jgi:hypothetical protein
VAGGVSNVRRTSVDTTRYHLSPLIVPFGQKTRPGRCPEPGLIALRTLMISQARGGLLLEEIPGILNICADREPVARCPVNFQRVGYLLCPVFHSLRFVPALDLSVRLRVKRRGSDVRHAPKIRMNSLKSLAMNCGPLSEMIRVRVRVLPTPKLFEELAGATRLELATSCVTGRRSNQLNYAPAVLASPRVPCCTFAFPPLPRNTRQCRDSTASVGVKADSILIGDRHQHEVEQFFQAS